jgi:hypothetical protein
MTTIHCPYCKTELELPKLLIGEKVSCSQCDKEFLAYDKNGCGWFGTPIEKEQSGLLKTSPSFIDVQKHIKKEIIDTLTGFAILIAIVIGASAIVDLLSPGQVAWGNIPAGCGMLAGIFLLILIGRFVADDNIKFHLPGFHKICQIILWASFAAFLIFYIYSRYYGNGGRYGGPSHEEIDYQWDPRM